MKRDYECRFCGNPSTKYEGVNVCKDCETVCFFENVSINEKHQKITEYLGEIQSRVLEQQDYFHRIEQKFLSGEILLPLEQEIRTNLLEFQSIRGELEVYIRDGSALNSKNDRQLLYRLLMLSKWLSKYFRRDT